MKASDFLPSLPVAHSSEREAKIVECISEGNIVAIQWYALRCRHKDHCGILYVASDALMLGEAGDCVRINASHTGQQQIADALGLRLPTTKVCDLIHSEAEEGGVLIRPQFQTPDAHMADTARMAQHSRCVDAAIAGRLGLVDTVGKSWVLTNSLLKKKDLGANYGWHDRAAPNHKMWQTLGLKHNRYHCDYSQTVRLVHSQMLVDGKCIGYDEVLTDSELCGLISDEGVLRLVRHPDVPKRERSDVLTTPDVTAATVPPPKDCVFIQARHFTPSDRVNVDLIVLHSMECPEKPGTAVAVAKWFASEKAPKASCHFCVDNIEVVQCVCEHDIAWHAPGANGNGIGIEHAGYARQSRDEWLDAYGTSMLELSAKLVAELCKTWQIPVEFVNADGLKAGMRGITTHWEVSKAFKKSDHYDPGPNFPIDEYISMVADRMVGDGGQVAAEREI